MKKIRHGVFETNSSSSHSISIADAGSLLDTILPDSDGRITLQGGEFGWGYEEYSDAQTKASYLAVYAQEYCGDSDTYKDLLDKILKEQTGAKEVIYNFSADDGHGHWSYIDHQSTDVPQDVFREGEEAIRQFIFNPLSILVIDNDNH
jgi:hypothetical protein